jgi:methyl-accepting chemotaxis protein
VAAFSVIAKASQHKGQAIKVGNAAELVLDSAGELAKQSERLKKEVESFLGTVRAA